MNTSLNAVFKNISKSLLKNRIIKNIINISTNDQINLLNAKIYDEKQFEIELKKVVSYYGQLPSY